MPLTDEAVRVADEAVRVALPAERSRLRDFSELIKVRLTALVLITTLVGFYAGTHGALDRWLLFNTFVGTALLAGGAAALNQFIERSLDGRMHRTQDRPLPAGRLQPATALVCGGLASLVGMTCLAVLVNPLAGLIGTFSLASYLFVYTPLKRVTTLNTVVGAIPGALPPLIGWAAARGELTLAGWSLFAVQFFWQLPHFLAIAWLYREDYARAGFKMLPLIDPTGERTALQAVSHTLGLFTVSLSPFLLGLAGPVYLAGALLAGLAFLGFAVAFARDVSRARARALFLASIVYLPLVFGLMVWDKAR